MSNIKFKNVTIKLIDKMIEHADQGISGFWVDDYDGCGNPEIFPEFQEGINRGRLIQKEHYLCPWNKAIMFGDKHGNIHTGCYHSCSFGDAKYLSTDMIRIVLGRFRKRMLSGIYDNLEHIEPLLLQEEIVYIKEAKKFKQKETKRCWEQERVARGKKANELLKKYQNNEDIRSLLLANYGENVITFTEKGCIDFSPEKYDDVVSAKALSYNEYLDIQIQSLGKQRTDFEMCYYNFPSKFKGKIEKINHKKRKICFERVFVTGMYLDDCSFFDGKEEHVWMDLEGFETYNKGDCVSFFAEVYRYVKTGNGKILDYGLRNPKSIQRIESYRLPTDDELIRQFVNQIICETCYLSDWCNRVNCIRNIKELSYLREEMVTVIKSRKE